MRVQPSGHLTRLCVFATLMAVAGFVAAQTQNTKPAARPVPVANNKAKSVAEPAASYAIAKAPEWVRPLAVDPSITVPKAPLQILLADYQTRVGPAATTRYVHIVRQINDASGMQHGAQIEIVFDPSYQKLVLHSVDILRDGKRTDKLDRKLVKLLHRETQLEQQVIDGRMTASIVLDDLRVGDRVEWSASLLGDNPVFGGRFVDNEWVGAINGPVGQFQARLLAPTERNIRYQTNASGVSVDTEVQDGMRELRFRKTTVAKIEYDANVPARQYFNKNAIEYSEFADWTEVANWAERLFSPALRASAPVDALVADIQAKANTPEERLRLALDFVQHDIRYFGTEIGANTHQPVSADTVLRQRFGDCKDKAVLLTALLNGLGFEASPVLVSLRQGEDVARRLPSPLAFDHAIASVKLDGQTLWLDGTRAYQSGAVAARQPVGFGQGLPISNGTGALVSMPGTRDVLRMETAATFSFPKLAENGTLESVTTYYGDAAESVRGLEARMSGQEFERLMTDDLLRIYPKFTLEGPVRVVSSASLNAVTVTARFRTMDYWRFPDQTRLMGDFALLSLGIQLRLPERLAPNEPLRLMMPGRYKYAVKFVFGEEAFGKPSDSRFDESNELFDLHIRYDTKPLEGNIAAELSQWKDVVEPAQLALYRDKLDKVRPRLTGTMQVPSLTTAQLEAFRAEWKRWAEMADRGKISLTTATQVEAQINALMLEKQLASERLPVKVRAEVLVKLGIKLDHLGRIDEARDKFQQSLAITPDSAEALAAMAVNALFRKKPEEAIERATQALQIAPGDSDPRYTRAYTHYFFGDMTLARDEFRDLLQSSTEVERSYGAIWLHLASRRLGADGKQAVADLLPTAAKPAWPYPVLQYLNSKIPFAEALEASHNSSGKSDKGRECELYFYAAQKAVLDKDMDLARSYLKKSLATGVIEFNEYAMAKFEMDRIEKK